MKGIPLSFWIFITFFLIIEIIQNDYADTFKKIQNMWFGDKKKNMLFRWTIYSSVLAILFVLGSEVQQFIYAQF